MIRTSLVAILFFLPLAALAQQPLPSGIQAGIDAYHEAEAGRRGAVQQQVQLNEALRYRLPWPAPYGETVYYSGYSPAYGYRGGYFAYPSFYTGTFGYAYTPMIRQPIGQRQVQTSPTRWESFPVYGEEAPLATEAVPEPTFIEPPPAPGPEPRPRRGPREF